MNVKEESVDIYPNLLKICRLCLTEDAETVNIFDSKENLNIPMQIMACTAIEMHFTDALPKQICRDCRIQLERSYYFRKRSQLSDAKLRKHIRLINAGKISKVFEPKKDEDEDNDDDELKDSLNFLKKVQKDEEEKQQKQNAELEDAIRQKIREEEMDRIFDEARSFFSSKINNKSKKIRETEPNEIKHVEHAEPSRLTPVETSGSVFENVVDSTEMIYTENSKEDMLDENQCYVLKVSDNNGTEFEIQDEAVTDQQMEGIEFTVVKVEVDQSGSMNFQSLNFENIENNEDDVEQDSDEEYNVEHDSMMDEHSDNSNIQLYTITGTSDAEQDLDNPTEEIVIALSGDNNNENSQNAEDDLDENKNEEYLEESNLENDSRKRQSDLIEVNNSQNMDELKIFKCAHCPQAFTRRTQLARHVTVHDKLRRFQCEHCRKWFACKSSLDRHRRVHSGEKPFECHVCHRRFIQKEILKRHLYIHTGERPYACPHCNKSFVQRQMLTSHINLKHTDNPVVQMHECFLCPKSFCHASGLSRHLLTHSGISYTCKKCGKQFNDKSAVKRHMSSVH